MPYTGHTPQLLHPRNPLAAKETQMTPAQMLACMLWQKDQTIAQDRAAVPAFVVVLEVADDYMGFERLVR
jgi:hypothetical protein